MADGNQHPFNSDLVTRETIVLFRNQSTFQFQPNLSKDHQLKELADLLSLATSNNSIVTSTDSTASHSSHSLSHDDFDRLKSLLRSTLLPIDHPTRDRLWMNILTLDRSGSSKQTSQTYLTAASMANESHAHSSPSRSIQWPTFVDTNNLCFYHLNEPKASHVVQHILTTFALHHPDFTYCPALQPLTSLLLHYYNEHEVLFLLDRLLRKNWLCGETRLQWETNVNVFKELFRNHYKSGAEMIDSLHTDSKEFYRDWFWWIFRHLPFSYLIKIMDCFLLEGPKVLYRISLALVHLFAKAIKRDPNAKNKSMAQFCQQIPISVDQLLRVSFQIRNFKRRTIDHLVEQQEKHVRHSHHPQSSNDGKNVSQTNSSKDGMTSISRAPPSISSQHFTRLPTKSKLDRQQFVTLWNWLPARLSLSQPLLVFTTEEHGFRLQTLLDKVDEIEYSLLIIKATNGEIFGAFCAGLWADRHQRTYFGFGESFLFTLVPRPVRYAWVGQQPQADADDRQEQKKRELFLFVSREKIVVGGGHGDGLVVDQSLCEGRTAHCDTFDNQPLCSQADFSISALEIIAFDFSSS